MLVFLVLFFLLKKIIVFLNGLYYACLHLCKHLIIKSLMNTINILLLIAYVRKKKGGIVFSCIKAILIGHVISFPSLSSFIIMKELFNIQSAKNYLNICIVLEYPFKCL